MPVVEAGSSRYSILLVGRHLPGLCGVFRGDGLAPVRKVCVCVNDSPEYSCCQH